jgi:hypothetical protein
MLEVALDEEKSLYIGPDAIDKILQEAEAEKQELAITSVDDVVENNSTQYSQLKQALKHGSLPRSSFVKNVYYKKIMPLFSSFIESDKMVFSTDVNFFKISKRLNKNRMQQIAFFEFEEYKPSGEIWQANLLFIYNDPIVLEIAGDTILKLNSLFERLGYRYCSRIGYNCFDDIKVD